MSNKIIEVQNIKVNVTNIDDNDYICISDFGKYKEGKSKADDIIRKWLRNRITLEFLGTWESIYNPNFNSVEFDGFRKSAGLHTFTLSVTEWCEKTNAIGIYSKRGKYGGTYAHKDIAFEFASAISPVFKLYLIKEFERLKEIENQNREWDVKRILTKNNYLIHTDAIKNYILPDNDFYKNREWLKYAEEADILNVVIFNTTAKKWRELNPDLAKNSNVRDYATINELTVLSNLESHNAELIKEGKSKEERFEILSKIAKYHNDKYVIKVCTNKELENTFETEKDFYLSNKDNCFIPKLYKYDDAKVDCDYIYEVIEKVEGKTLYYYWYKMSETDKEKTIEKLIDIIKKFHSVNGKEYDWKNKIKGEIKNRIINSKYKGSDVYGKICINN